MFFIALFNVYVYTLVYLNWPVELFESVTLEEEIEMQGRNIYSIDGNDHNHNNNQKVNGKRDRSSNYQYNNQSKNLQIETEESKVGDSSHIVASDTRDIKIEF
jgi:hypothetical protein